MAGVPWKWHVVMSLSWILASNCWRSSSPIAMMDFSFFCITTKLIISIHGWVTCLIVIGRFIPLGTGISVLAVWKKQLSKSLMSVSQVLHSILTILMVMNYMSSPVSNSMWRAIPLHNTSKYGQYLFLIFIEGSKNVSFAIVIILNYIYSSVDIKLSYSYIGTNGFNIWFFRFWLLLIEEIKFAFYSSSMSGTSWIILIHLPLHVLRVWIGSVQMPLVHFLILLSWFSTSAFTKVPVVACVSSFVKTLGVCVFWVGVWLCTIYSKILVISVESPSFLSLHSTEWDRSGGHLLNIWVFILYLIISGLATSSLLLFLNSHWTGSVLTIGLNLPLSNSRSMLFLHFSVPNICNIASFQLSQVRGSPLLSSMNHSLAKPVRTMFNLK